MALSKTTFTDYSTVISADFLNTLQDEVINTIGYGTCATAAATKAKVVTISDFTLETGATVKVKFTYTNTASAPTLNVNDTGAKSIAQYGTTAAGINEYTSWPAGGIVTFTYDGTYWVMNDQKVFGEVVTAAWASDQSTGSLETVTEDVSLSPGTWLCIGSTPVSDMEDMFFTLRSMSGTTDIGSNHFYTQYATSYTPINLIFNVTATANVVLRTARAVTVNYTYTERGGLTFVKLA